MDCYTAPILVTNTRLLSFTPITNGILIPVMYDQTQKDRLADGTNIQEFSNTRMSCSLYPGSKWRIVLSSRRYTQFNRTTIGATYCTGTGDLGRLLVGGQSAR